MRVWVLYVCSVISQKKPETLETNRYKLKIHLNVYR